MLETFRPNQTFTIADLERACPTVSRATIRRVLGELRARGQVECLGKGRSAQWRKVQMCSFNAWMSTLKYDNKGAP